VRLGRSSEHGLKLIIARAAAGDAIWLKATVDRIADILSKQGDSDTVKVRRSKAIGILTQPALALQLLCQHQDDDWDGPAEPTEPAEDELGFDDAPAKAETGVTTAEPTPDPPGWRRASVAADRVAAVRAWPARPRSVVYVHVSTEGLTAGSGVARVERSARYCLAGYACWCSGTWRCCARRRRARSDARQSR